MPELPEVETTLRGIEPVMHPGSQIQKVVVRQRQLRWPIPDEIVNMTNIQVEQLLRRGKYILIETENGTLILHLGMSGSVRIVDRNQEPHKHDHVDMIMKNGPVIRYTDPRRFGCLLFSRDWRQHALIRQLGPEPLSDDFSPSYLYQACKNSRTSIKQRIMNSRIVVGVGNIYANEALFIAGIRPTTKASRLSKAKAGKLHQAIVSVLTAAINQGGTTLKDFSNTEGKPGYFKQSLHVYGRQGESCMSCGSSIKKINQNQRSSFFCPCCQK